MNERILVTYRLAMLTKLRNSEKVFNLIISALWDKARAGQIGSRGAIRYAGNKRNTLQDDNVEFSW